jgi:hypothetical protein
MRNPVRSEADAFHIAVGCTVVLVVAVVLGAPLIGLALLVCALAGAFAWAEAEGVAVTGKVGDANAALGAIEDELRRYGADEVIISTYPPGESNWLETGIVERLRDELDIPVTHVVMQARSVV